MEKITIIPESLVLIKITDAEYFSSEYSEYISNSKLSLIDPSEGGSIEKFNTGFDSSYSDSFALGSAIHNMLLQPEYYKIAGITKPNGKLGIFIEAVYEFRKQNKTIADSLVLASKKTDYYAKQFSDKRIKTAIKSGLSFYLKRMKVEEELSEIETMYLSEGVSSKFNNIMLNIAANKTILNNLSPDYLFTKPEIYNEYAILAEVEVKTQHYTKRLKLKAKLDNFIINDEQSKIILNDLKTSGKSLNYFMGGKGKVITEEGEEKWIWYDGSFQKYHYYRQMALYFFLLKALLNKPKYNGFSYDVNMLVVETIPDFNSKIFKVKNSDIKRGLDEFKKLLILVTNEQ